MTDEKFCGRITLESTSVMDFIHIESAPSAKKRRFQCFRQVYHITPTFVREEGTGIFFQLLVLGKVIACVNFPFGFVTPTR